MAGLVGLTGGSGLEALGNGANVTARNSALKQADQQYRQSLQGLGVDTSQIPGFLDQDSYAQYLTGLKTKSELEKDERQSKLDEVELATRYVDLTDKKVKLADYIKNAPTEAERNVS
jgi:hypothetical protein